MYIHEEVIECGSRSDRLELFPVYDAHVGKVNCAEGALRKLVDEVIRQNNMPHRHARVVGGGDQVNSIRPQDIRRFDFHELADWLLVPDTKKKMCATEVAEHIKAKLSNLGNQEVDRFVEIFEPVKDLFIGALEGNHEKCTRNRNNVDVHSALCTKLDTVNLTDEAVIRFKFRRGGSSQVVKMYLRHGYGAGRTAGAEPLKLQRMIDEWEDMDVCLSGHSHSFNIMPPKPVLYIPNKGKLPDRLLSRYRFGANPGCWLHSHHMGQGTYESISCYPAKPMMTLKIVVWPFWNTNGLERPKIELRQYPIL
jgi:hypothetical protein